MSGVRGWGAAWLAAFLVLGSMHAQQQVDVLRTRLRVAEADSELDVAGMMPWHLKLDVQLFDEKGKPTENGTIEEWWVARNLNKVTFSFPSSSVTEIHNEDGFFRTKGEAYEPVILEDVLEQVVHPMELGDLTKVVPDLRKEKIGKVDLECIMADEPLKNVAYPPLGLFPTYCLDPGKDSLRITTELGSVMFLRNNVGHFQQHSVAVDLLAQTGNTLIAKAHIAALSTVKTSEIDLTPSAEMKAEHEAASLINSSVMTGSILNKVQPIYPRAAKLNHSQGSVIFRALIGRDGRVRSLHIISTPDSDLAMAAIAAVRLWTYKPYLLNGMPTEVDTTITVNFAFGPA